MNPDKIIHQYTVSVFGPGGQYTVKNSTFIATSDSEREDAYRQAKSRANEILQSNEFNSIAYHSEFDVSIDYIKTEIYSSIVSARKGELVDKGS